MILDYLALLADGQTGTLSAASTNVVNTVAAGDSYEGAWFVARVDTAFTAGAGAPTATFQIQTSDEEDFSGPTTFTLAQSAAYLAADLTAGKFWAVRIPPGALKYIRGYKVVDDGTGAKRFSAGAWDFFIVKDIDLEINKRKLLQ